MENTQKTKSPLETEPLSRLLLRYSVPTTLTLMVNYLYNVVDQIFVGQGVGITGMSAINVAFPVSILVNAVSRSFAVTSPMPHLRFARLNLRSTSTRSHSSR